MIGNSKEILDRCQQNLHESISNQNNNIFDPKNRNVNSDEINVRFREIDNINLWLWIEMEHPPDKDEIEGLEEVIRSWFILGKLGAYDSFRLHAHNHSGPLQDLRYDSKSNHNSQIQTNSSISLATSHFHQLGDLQYKGCWCRIWVDIGNADNLCFDILINALRQFSHKFVGVKQCYIGGVNDVRPL